MSPTTPTWIVLLLAAAPAADHVLGTTALDPLDPVQALGLDEDPLTSGGDGSTPTSDGPTALPPLTSDLGGGGATPIPTDGTAPDDPLAGALGPLGPDGGQADGPGAGSPGPDTPAPTDGSGGGAPAPGIGGAGPGLGAPPMAQGPAVDGAPEADAEPPTPPQGGDAAPGEPFPGFAAVGVLVVFGLLVVFLATPWARRRVRAATRPGARSKPAPEENHNGRPVVRHGRLPDPPGAARRRPPND